MKLFDRVRAVTLKPVPPGWMTGDQLARKEGYSEFTAMRKVLAEALRLGIIRKKSFKVLWGATVRDRPHYKYAK